MQKSEPAARNRNIRNLEMKATMDGHDWSGQYWITDLWRKTRIRRSWRRDGKDAELRFNYRAEHAWEHCGKRGTSGIERSLTRADVVPRAEARRWRAVEAGRAESLGEQAGRLLGRVERARLAQDRVRDPDLPHVVQGSGAWRDRWFATAGLRVEGGAGTGFGNLELLPMLGAEFVPKADYSESWVNFHTPVGSSIERKPGGLDGNTTDTNANDVDWFVQAAPNPQSLAAPLDFQDKDAAPAPNASDDAVYQVAPLKSLLEGVYEPQLQVVGDVARSGIVTDGRGFGGHQPDFVSPIGGDEE